MQGYPGSNVAWLKFRANYLSQHATIEVLVSSAFCFKHKMLCTACEFIQTVVLLFRCVFSFHIGVKPVAGKPLKVIICTASHLCSFNVGHLKKKNKCIWLKAKYLPLLALQFVPGDLFNWWRLALLLCIHAGFAQISIQCFQILNLFFHAQLFLLSASAEIW